MKSKNKNGKKIQHNKKSIYKFNKIPSDMHYLVIFETNATKTESNYYYIIIIKNLSRYLSGCFGRNLLINRYYMVNKETFKFSDFEKYKVNNLEKTFKINDLCEIDVFMRDNYNIQFIIPTLNVEKNSNIQCKFCNTMPFENDKMLAHLRTCPTYVYTLFGEDIPKEVLKSMRIRNTLNEKD